ncbi:MAG TPA: Lrp/AsnC family transcriptional regulator [Nocardioidaceae bacterium]|nr:Lrp/AsnC family transcriptional regulator [Nocardioidaceae bacterium]
MHATEKMTAMDDIDSAIIEVLLSDGRATYARIGGAVGLSVAATKRRIDRLLRDNVIRGFTAVVDPQVLGWTLEAQVQLFTNGTVPFPTMRRDLERLPEVIEASTVSGSADAVLRVVAADVVQLERVISRLRGLSYVQQTDTTMLLSRLLSRPVAGPLIRADGG